MTWQDSSSSHQHLFSLISSGGSEPYNTPKSQSHTIMKPSIKLRLMCSSGGHILPRPHDKSLCYVGGETRMVVIDRHTTLPLLTHHLSTLMKTPAKGNSFILKYQLPSEDLDSLISVITDEDLENMIEEYERLGSSSRLRLFVFPTSTESGSLIGSVLENSVKSEDWFVKALNGDDLGFSDDSSVNLFGLDDEMFLPEKEVVDRKGIIGIVDFGGSNSGQDVNSIPDSTVMETSSSFGSASSTPSIQQKPSTGFDLVTSDLTNANDRATDPNDTYDQNPRIQMQQQIQSSTCLLSMPTTQIDSPRNQLHHQPQFTPPQQYIHHHPSGTVPVASYYQPQPHHPPIDQQKFIYYMPTRQLAQGYNFPSQHPVMVPSSHQNQPQYVGYSKIHQPGQLVYYATQAMAPLSPAHYNKMSSISPVEGMLQEHVRSAKP